MLDLSGNAAGNIDLRMYRYAGLSDLSVVVNEARVNCCTAGADLSMKFFRQFEKHVEALFAAYAVASGNDDGGAFEVVFCFLYVAVNHFYDVIRCRNILRHVRINHFSFIVFVKDFAFHDALAYCRHLRTVVRVYDCRYDVSAECGTDLVQKVVIMFARLLVIIVADFELRAVCCQSAGER